MDTRRRNNVKIGGNLDRTTMLFAHGFGCDQNMWRLVAPAFLTSHRIVLFDHVGAGGSEKGAWSKEKYSSLDGFARDIVEIGCELGLADAIFVGHSVAAMMGAMAAIEAPGMFRALVMVSPSPCYINDMNYTGGFSRSEIDELLDSLDQNHLGWSMAMAPVVMGGDNDPALADELANSFCRTEPEVASTFARTTFLSDSRSLLHEIQVPTLILQCSHDIIAPESVGGYVHEQIAGSKLVKLKATGHCPNLSAPAETIAAIKAFL